ncbi:MAG: hypothetical protein AB7Q81_19215 [Gammaproteobacteria bacterium]
MERPSRKRFAALAIAATLAFTALPVAAQQAAADAQRTAQALARAQGLLRELAAVKQQLEVDNAKLTAQKSALERRLDDADAALEDRAAELAASARDAKRLDTRLGNTEQRLEQARAKLEEALGVARDTARELAGTRDELARTQEQLAGTTAELDRARKFNLEMFETSREIVEAYRNKGRLAGWLQDEPVSGLSAVTIESRIEDFADRLYDAVDDANLEAARGLRHGAPIVSQPAD